MARMVIKTAKEPKQVGDEWICMCGLSKNQPFCDKTHKKIAGEDEQELFFYDENGAHVIDEVKLQSQEGCGNCEHCNCGHQKQEQPVATK